MNTKAEERERQLVISLESRGMRELDLADLVEDGQLQLYPYVEERGLLFFQFRRQKVILSAGPYVGLIPITPRITVEVRPKLPVENLARVLDVSGSSLSLLSGVDRDYLSENSSSIGVFEFLISNLLEKIRPIFSDGIHKTYIRNSEESGRIRGRIDVLGTMRSSWSRGHRQQVKTSQFEQSVDIPVNRLLKEAIRRFLVRGRGATLRGSREITRAANLAYMEFPASVGILKSSDIAECRDILSYRTLPLQKIYYYRAIEIALLIVNNGSISLNSLGNDITMGAFVLNFEDLFESYLRRVLEERCLPMLQVRDGNKGGKKPLFDDRRNPPAQPDIVVVNKEYRNIVIAEVKYKDSPNRDDINQSITYAVSYRTSRVVLVHQKKIGMSGGLRRIGTINGIDLQAYAYNLSEKDLEAEEMAFADGLFMLARSI